MRTSWAASLLGAALLILIQSGVPGSASVDGSSAGIVVRSDLDGDLHSAAPPPGRTGGFGEPTCGECHNSYDVEPGAGHLSIDGLPETFEPGRRYVVTVLLRDELMANGGFHASLRHLDGGREGAQAGVFGLLDNRLQLTPDPESGVEYVHQTTRGAELSAPGVASWTFGWTAPGVAGPVVLHVAANSANGDNSPLEDVIYVLADTIRSPGSPEGPIRF